jgi:PIN domain nuclease of toxin-antitoxin system
MILLDTHIWYWWVDQPQKLSTAQTKHLEDNEPLGLGVSVISCREIAKLVSLGRLNLGHPIDVWRRRSLAYPGIQLVGLTADIVIEANQLPGAFHRDPADQILVATARVLGVPLLTADSKILAYPHVKTLV